MHHAALALLGSRRNTENLREKYIILRTHLHQPILQPEQRRKRQRSSRLGIT